MGIYEELGIRRVINACGTWTILGGSAMQTKTLKAMVEAAQCFVDMEELHEKAGKIIAKITGAEGGYVTSGAAAGLVLAAAACIAGKDVAKIRQLPNTDGLRNEVIIQKGHRYPRRSGARGSENYYVNNLRLAGAKLIEVGTDLQCTPQDIESAINEKTVAIVHFMRWETYMEGVNLEEVITIAKKHAVPTIVDAAGELPPIENLKKFISMGADIVTISGGKALQGPNASGILCGRKDLIEAASLQGYIGTESMKIGTIGRPMKVGRETIVGLIVALKEYATRDHEAESKAWDAKTKYLVEELRGLSSVDAKRVVANGSTLRIPYVQLRLDEKALGMTLNDLVSSLETGEPSIRVWLHQGKMFINPRNLLDGEERIIAKRLKEILTRNCTN